jgi:group I intron endonuclease
MPIVYKITNTLTKKSYIGWTGKTVEARWQQHKKSALKNKVNTKFYNSIRKYGVDCWQVDTLQEVSTNCEAKQLEIDFISKYKTYENGYNSTFGGDGNNGIIMSEESNIKRSNKLKGIKKPKGWNLHRTHSESTKNKISNSHLNMKKPWVKWNDEQIKKRSMPRRSLTKEQYDKMQTFRKDGMVTKKIAEILGVSNDVVKKWIHKDW